MNNNHERDARWFAYLLGELPEADRAQVESQHAQVETEMAASPDEAAKFRAVCEGVHSWAAESVIGPAMDLHALLAKGQIPAQGPRPAWWAKAWPWAVAATFLIAISELSFSVQLGDTTIAWGQPAAPAASVPADDLLKRLDAIETASLASQQEVATMAARALSIEEEMRDATAELAYNQQLEAEARFRDIERLIALTGLGGQMQGGYSSAMYTDNP